MARSARGGSAPFPAPAPTPRVFRRPFRLAPFPPPAYAGNRQNFGQLGTDMAKTRRSLSKTFVWVLMGLLFIGLAGFGATNFSGQVHSVGAVGEKSIEVDRYARALQQEMRQLSGQMGRTVSFAEAQDMGLDQQVLGEMITARALDHEADRLGLSVGDATLHKQILDISAFQGPDGSFDRQSYRFALENAGLTEAAFEEQLREESARTILQAAVLADAPMPAPYAGAIVDFVAERRDITYAVLTEADLAEALPSPDEDALRAHYEAHLERWTRPEAKRLTVARLTPAMLLDSIELDEETLRKAYEERAAQYDQPERRLVERLAFDSNEAAEAALSRIEAGETDFEALVADRDLALADIDMGDVTRKDLGAAAEAVFAAAQGDIVGPAPSDLGPALYRVNGVLEAQSVSFEEAEEELRAELATDRARRLIAGRAEEANDMLAGGATLEDLAAETQMQIEEITWYPGADVDMNGYPAFREAAEAATAEDFPEMIELDDGSAAALRVDEVLEPAPYPFEEVREQVAEDWRAAELVSRLEAQAQEAVPQLSEGRDFAALDLPAQRREDLMRNQAIDGTPEGTVERVFEMREGTLGVVRGRDRVAILRLDAVKGPAEDSEEVAQMRERAQDRAADSLARDLFQVLATDIQARAGIEIDRQALNAVHASFQ